MNDTPSISCGEPRLDPLVPPCTGLAWPSAWDFGGRVRSSRVLGVTLLEMLIVLAVMGIMMGIAITSLHPERFAVQQALSALASEVSSTRIEAIRKNEYVGIQFQVDTNRYRVYLDKDNSRSYSTGDVVLTDQPFDANANPNQNNPYKGVSLSAISVGGAASNTYDLVFDARGIPRTAQAAVITIANTGGSYSRQLSVSLQGKTKNL